MRVAVADRTTLKASQTIPTPMAFTEGMTLLKQLADHLLGKEKIAKIAGGVAGALDQGKTRLVSSPHIKGWIGKPFKESLEKTFGCSVMLENDAGLAGLGEATVHVTERGEATVHVTERGETVKGAGKGKSIVAYLTIGTGVGGARIVDGRIDKNALGFEPGHQIIAPFGHPCNCGGRGHLETYVGGFYLKRMYGQEASQITDEHIWDEVSRNLSIGLANITVLWSPEVIVIGGSVSKSLPLDKVRSYTKQYVSVFPDIPLITLGTLGAQAGLYGALSLLSSQK